MKNELSVNPTEFGIEEKQANEMVGNLPQIQRERLVLQEQFDEIIKMDIESIETSKKARELRLLIQKNRTQGINTWHKTTKDYFLKGGQFVDAIKRVEVSINERMENALEEIEKYQENLEKERFEAEMKIRLERVNQFNNEITLHDVRQFNNENFELFLSGVEKQYNDKIEADKKTEAERIESERLEKERIAEERRVVLEKIEAQRLENETLKKEADKREAELKAEREKAEQERKRVEAENNAKLDAERKERERIESELKAKQEAELKAEREKVEMLEKEKKEAEKLAKAPIKKQLSVWVESFEIPYATSDVLSNDVAKEIKEKFEAFKKWSKTQIENI